MSTSLKVVSMAAVCCASTSRCAMVWRRRDIRTRSSRRDSTVTGMGAGCGVGGTSGAGAWHGWAARAGDAGVDCLVPGDVRLDILLGDRAAAARPADSWPGRCRRSSAIRRASGVAREPSLSLGRSVPAYEGRRARVYAPLLAAGVAWSPPSRRPLPCALVAPALAPR